MRSDDRQSRAGCLGATFLAGSVRILTNKAGRGSEIRDMAWKDTMLYSILGFKCPYCHTGDFFVSHPYDLRHTGDVHDHCGHCGRRFNIEPGFYYGAMYVSYAIGVAAMVTVWVACSILFPDLSPTGLVIAILSTLLAGAPYFYALSKIIWANLFFKYDRKSAGPGDQVGH